MIKTTVVFISYMIGKLFHNIDYVSNDMFIHDVEHVVRRQLNDKYICYFHTLYQGETILQCLVTVLFFIIPRETEGYRVGLVRLSVRLSVCLSVCLSVRPSVRPP